MANFYLLLKDSTYRVFSESDNPPSPSAYDYMSDPDYLEGTWFKKKSTLSQTKSYEIQMEPHMGIIYLEQAKPFVFEASQTVKLNPLHDWVARGKGGHFVVKRLANATRVLDYGALKRMKQVGKAFKGKSYDPYFEWSDNRMYCSELFWKIYKRALGLDIGKRQTMSEFHLSDPLVQAKVRERFGESLPKDETVISPSAIFDSKLLVTAHEE